MAELLTAFFGADENSIAEAYQCCFLSTEVAIVLLNHKEELTKFIERGLQLSLVYTTTLCAVRIRQLTGLTLVAGEQGYNHAWLYSLALAGQVDPGPVVLGERQADVAFQLAEVWLKAAGRPPLRDAAGGPEPAAVPVAATGNTVPGNPVQVGVAAGAPQQAQAMDDDSENEAAAASPLAWEDEREQLPGDLAQVLARHTAGALQLDPRSWLEDLPRWDGVKDRPEVNNHRGDKEKSVEKLSRAVQAKLLGLKRIYLCPHSDLQDAEAT